jgi:hypothetical protein
MLLPGYEHDIEKGAGLSVGAGRPKVVLHTTESPRGSYAAVRNLWRGPANWGKGLPHFLADGARYVQLLPLNVGAYTLENSPGGADTNRSGPAIQVEICGRAAEGFNDLEYEALGRWLADLVKAGVDLDLAQHPTFYGLDAGFTLASYNARQRLSADAYNAFNGFLGHQHVPENAHWDPGKLDAARVERLARKHLGAGGNSAPIPEPPDEEDDDMKAPRPSFLAPTKGRWGVNAAGKLVHIAGPATEKALDTPNQGNPPELQPAIGVTDETLDTLISFYNS